MNSQAQTVLFFDASCLIAAALSPQGGSAALIGLCGSSRLAGAYSQPVLLETERNLREKAPAEARWRLHIMLEQTPLQVAGVDARLLNELPERINTKDRHVLAAALACGAAFLITLDRGLISEVASHPALPLQPITPGGFIREVLPALAGGPEPP